MWEEHPKVFREMRDVATSGKESSQFPAFPRNGIYPSTRDVAAFIHVEKCQIVTCISNGNECLVSDAFAAIEVNLCDSARVDSVIVDDFNNVLVPKLIDIAIVSAQSTGEVQLFSILLDDALFDIGSDK